MTIKIETVYKPIEVEIKGRTFKVRPYDREAAKLNNEWDLRTQQGDTEANYERLLYMIGLPPDSNFVDDLDFRYLNALISEIFKAIREGDSIESAEEKKSSGRGGKK